MKQNLEQMKLTLEQVSDVIDSIAATSSKTAKEEIIRSHADDALFKDVLLHALNPFITYGIAKIPEHTPSGVGNNERSQWLTVIAVLHALSARKVTGNAARDLVTKLLNTCSQKEAALVSKILLKDLRAGFSESTVNKAIPGLIPTFDCMLAHPYSEHKHKLSFPLFVEPKLDGVRVLTFVTGELPTNVRFFSRSGKEFTTFDHLKEPVSRMFNECAKHSNFGDGIVIEAEVVSGSFNKTVSEVRKKDVQATDAKLYAFDVLPVMTFRSDSKSGCPHAGNLKERRQLLEKLFSFKKDDDPLVLLPSIMVSSEEEIHYLYEKFRARGLEGAIVKDPNGLYHRRRNHAWCKIKAEESVDIRIIGAEEGTGKYVGMLGAILADFKGVTVRIGSGLSDDQRKEMWTAYLDDCGPEAVGGFVGRLIEVEYHEVTPDGSLRHPRFVRFRDDKDDQG